MTQNGKRTKMSLTNASAAVFCKLVGMVLNFITRTVFIKKLGTEYLGLGGFFGNIFSVISLCELGFGAAFAQSLYKPIAQEDRQRVSGIITYFSQIYSKIAFVSAVLGVFVMPFLPLLTKGQTEISGLYSIYVLFMLHNTLNFLLTPKRTLVICDQRMYAVSNFRTLFSVIMCICQVVLLETTNNYIVYLSSRIFLLTLEGVCINIYADRRYDFLKTPSGVDEIYRKKLFSNVKSLMLHKIGSVLTHSTDSILISYFLGLTCMGKYSNYALIVGSVVTFVDIAVGSVSSSVGNLGATASVQKNENIMKKLSFVNFSMLTLCSSVLLCTLNPFIKLWIGEEMLFSMPEVAVIVASFYFSCIRDPVQIFINAYGIFRPSRYMNIARAAVNFVLSVLLVKRFGVAGVFGGTVVSVWAVPLWFEVYVLYKYGFRKSPLKFALSFAVDILFSVISCAICLVLTRSMKDGFAGLAASAIVCSTASVVVVALRKGCGKLAVKCCKERKNKAQPNV